MTKSYIKSYIRFHCGQYGKGLAWAEHISSLQNKTTSRIEVTPYKEMKGRMTYRVVIVDYLGPNCKDTKESGGVSLTTAVNLFYEWDKS